MYIFLNTFIHTKGNIFSFCSLLSLVKRLYFPYNANADGFLFFQNQAFSLTFPHFYLVEKLSW